jgi:hypothetical protein
VNIGGQFATAGGGFLVGPSAQWVEELLPYALDDGAATFILSGDDPATMQRFAEEVAPALRSAVERERASAGTATGAVKKAAVIALRRDGIDYDAVPAGIEAVEPGDLAYANVRSTYMRGGAPGLVLRPADTGEVVRALAFARAQPVPLGVRSGGHGVSGRSTNDGGIVIDLGLMNAIEVLDTASRRVRIQPGARWMDVAAALEPHGWGLSSGDYGGVGVGGLATAGGIGFLVREHGLTIDHLRAVEIVLADGSVVTASDTENADLFWAVRGAGANFGIVTSFEFEVDDVGQVGFAQLAFDASDTAGFLEGWGAVVEAAPRDLTSFLIMGAVRAGNPAVAQLMSVVDSDDPDTVLDRLQPLANLAPLVQQSVRIMPYAAVMANASDAPHAGHGEPQSRSGLLEHITPEFAAAAATMLESGDTSSRSVRSAGPSPTSPRMPRRTPTGRQASPWWPSARTPSGSTGCGTSSTTTSAAST